MAKIFITGSSDGLGQLAAMALIKDGHQVVLHARNVERGKQAMAKVPGATDVLIADLSSIEETKALAANANDIGRFDAVIHNAGIYKVKDNVNADGLSPLFKVNTLAPYIMTCLMPKPGRLIYLSSDMHLQGDPNLHDLAVDANNALAQITYADTKLHNLILAKTVARRWPGVYANAVDPGWVPTKMGGPGAPDSLEQGYQTQVWLAVSHSHGALVSDQYFHHMRQARYLPAADSEAAQEGLIELCERLTGVNFP